MLYEISYYLKPDEENKRKVELDLYNYVTRSDLKDTTGIGTGKLEIDKSQITPADLSKLSNVVKMMLLKRLYMMN